MPKMSLTDSARERDVTALRERAASALGWTYAEACTLSLAGLASLVHAVDPALTADIHKYRERTPPYAPRPAIVFARGTWLEDEEMAGPCNAQRRKGRAWFQENGKDKIVAVRAAVADTFFTIPAHIIRKKKRVRGYLTTDDNGLRFHAYKRAE